jgi:DNA-binding transcriptional ArsR family regulator
MGVTKTEHYSDQQNALALLMKALGHPARVAIVEYLLTVNSCICSDIVNELPLAQPTVSQHLKELKTAGIIRGSIEGTAICYCINETAVGILQNYFADIAFRINQKNISCCTP